MLVMRQPGFTSSWPWLFLVVLLSLSCTSSPAVAAAASVSPVDGGGNGLDSLRQPQQQLLQQQEVFAAESRPVISGLLEDKGTAATLASSSSSSSSLAPECPASNSATALRSLQDAVDVMQREHFALWVGTWPAAIEWTAAVTNAHLVVAMECMSRATVGESSTRSPEPKDVEVENRECDSENDSGDDNVARVDTENVTASNGVPIGDDICNDESTKPPSYHLSSASEADNDFLSDGLNHNGGPHSTRHSPLEDQINTYYAHTTAYYFGEDTFEVRNNAFDDMLWLVLGWLRTSAFTREHTARHQQLHQQQLRSASEGSPRPARWHGQQFLAAYAHRARIFYDLASRGWDTRFCGAGGMLWDAKKEPFKNAVTNHLWIAASVAMFLGFPGDAIEGPYSHRHRRWRGSDGEGEREGYGGRRSGEGMRGEEEVDRTRFLTNAVHGYEWLSNSGMRSPRTGLYIDGFHVSAWKRNHSATTGECECPTLFPLNSSSKEKELTFHQATSPTRPSTPTTKPSSSPPSGTSTAPRETRPTSPTATPSSAPSSPRRVGTSRTNDPIPHGEISLLLLLLLLPSPS
jgi:hypothetical protein